MFETCLSFYAEEKLIAAGWSGCDNYSCLGAGQAISTFLRSINIELGEHQPEKRSRLLMNLTNVYSVMSSKVFRQLVRLAQEGEDEQSLKLKVDRLRVVLKDLSAELSEKLLDPDYRIQYGDWGKKIDGIIKESAYKKGA